MHCTGWNFDALAFTQLNPFSIYLDDCRPSNDVEELARTAVEMALLHVSRRNTLLNDAEIFALQKMPAFTAITPSVVLSV